MVLASKGDGADLASKGTTIKGVGDSTKLTACLCGCVSVWLCGCVAVWLYGCVAAWLHGCVALCFFSFFLSQTEMMVMMLATMSKRQKEE